MLLPSLSQIRRVEQICDEFETAWKAGARPRLEDHLALAQADTDLLRHLLPLEWEYRLRAGEQPHAAEYISRFPDACELIRLTEREMVVLVTADGNPPQRLGHYTMVREVGRGGMGVVYEALRQPEAQRVALKVFPRIELSNPAALERFWREAQTTARLAHPHIVPILEVGEAEGHLFLALEFVNGQSLEEALREAPLVPLHAAKLVEAIAGAMEYAHRQGIVHRDLKPANVLLEQTSTTNGGYTAKITDFGLAHSLHGRDLTMTGEIFGTPSYMAPEQTWGKCRSRRIGPAADVYALGAILYAALTGRPPFVACTAIDTLEMVRFQDPLPPSRLCSQVPRDLETICLKCLEKDPRDRYASAAALADDLRNYLAGEPIGARRRSCLQSLQRGCRRNAKTLLGIVALVAATGLAVWQTCALQLRQQQALTRAAVQETEQHRARAEQLEQQLLLRQEAAPSLPAHSKPTEPPLHAQRQWLARPWRYWENSLLLIFRMFVV